MSATHGIIVGGLALTALQVVVSNATAAGNVGAGLRLVASAVDHLVNLNSPLIPDLRQNKVADPTPATGAVNVIQTPGGAPAAAVQ